MCSVNPRSQPRTEKCLIRRTFWELLRRSKYLHWCYQPVFTRSTDMRFLPTLCNTHEIDWSDVALIMIMTWRTKREWISIGLRKQPDVFHSIRFCSTVFFMSRRISPVFDITLDLCFVYCNTSDGKMILAKKSATTLFIQVTSYLQVRRFLIQVSTDEVALTGCSFFSVTRSLMLTVRRRLRERSAWRHLLVVFRVPHPPKLLRYSSR